MGRTVLPAEVLTLVDYCQHSTNNHHPYTHNSLVDGEDGQDSVPPDVCVSDLKTSSDGWHERLKQFRFLQLAQEAKSGPSDELIRMLEIFPISITDKDHLMKEFPIRSGLGYDLPKDEQQFLECVVTLWHHILDDGHQKAGETLSVQHQLNYPLQSCSFVPDISITELFSELYFVGNL